MIVRLLIFLCLCLCAGLSAHAHEVRPAYLELTERAPGSYEGVWKQPVLDGRRLKLDPVFPEGCTRTRDRTESNGATLVTRFELTCLLDRGTLSINGLDMTLTDVFVRIDRASEEDISALLKPAAPTLDLATAKGAPVADYFIIGVEHIIFGYDHLLFVLGMVLLVLRRQILLTLTAFTIAHSITLALSALGGVSLPGAPVEIIIAMSIALLGAEVIYRARGRTTMSQRFPWAIAFGFGLIHGFGFAGALSEIGLPKGDEALALFLFNVGVEAGQIAVVLVILALGWLITRFATKNLGTIRTALAYSIGIIGSFWAIERLAGMMA